MTIKIEIVVLYTLYKSMNELDTFNWRFNIYA